MCCCPHLFFGSRVAAAAVQWCTRNRCGDAAENKLRAYYAFLAADCASRDDREDFANLSAAHQIDMVMECCLKSANNPSSVWCRTLPMFSEVQHDVDHDFFLHPSVR